jgi:hypothetical protein
MPDLSLTSPSFGDGEPIPDEHGYSVDNTNPPLEIADVPEEAESLALVVDDPDACANPRGRYGPLGRLEPRPVALRASQRLVADRRPGGAKRLR